MSVGILADIFTRVDLVYRALLGAEIPKVLGLSGLKNQSKASVVEI